jgi:hypothetical protein
MTLLIVSLSIITYAIMAMVVKTYFKLYRCLSYMPEDSYIIGAFWPIYAIYRLLAWPLGSGSRYIENHMVKMREAKEKAKVRVINHDRDLEEAEQEVESLLAQNQERSRL